MFVVVSSDACELRVDSNTVNRYLCLSDGGRTVTLVAEEQSYPDHSTRFEECHQLLCDTGLTGRCYWEVEWSGVVFIAVTYRSIKRRGLSDDCCFGANGQSWCLYCSDSSYYAYHNKRETSIILPGSAHSTNPPHKVGVYVDWPAGALSFYSVSTDSLIHLHTFKTSFTQMLFPGFVLDTNSSVSLCDL